ncbi:MULTISPECIES: hypothetical protein [Bacillaceae]|uniref:YxiS n=1 Tax=Domibacillus aminovorans TaxID=29332 RepID=A0A177L4E4_9BACI|nr:MULTISPECIES: hypothetical protein [Bacillaceae]OAH57704.1 hypothetical protein AWH48_01405 [Domibacillus aminovorans]OAH60423.1 hypothetical protein AWH49_16305 [Domibacillus aminovorans]
MNKKELENSIIENYQRDEQMMVFIFAQWCVNNDFDPIELYTQAYPNQAANDALKQAVELTVPKEEAGTIANETLLNVLSLYGNDDLSFIVMEEMNKRKK